MRTKALTIVLIGEYCPKFAEIAMLPGFPSLLLTLFTAIVDSEAATAAHEGLPFTKS
jgi:hypothetical protein